LKEICSYESKGAGVRTLSMFHRKYWKRGMLKLKSCRQDCPTLQHKHQTFKLTLSGVMWHFLHRSGYIYCYVQDCLSIECFEHVVCVASYSFALLCVPGIVSCIGDNHKG